MKTGTQLLKIGDFARLAGTNLRTLRYYEEIGLLDPAQRSEGGFRYYRETDVNRLHTVNSLQELGLTLQEIRDLIATREGNGSASRGTHFARVRRALEGQRELFARRAEEIQERIEELGVALQKLDECATCPHTPGPENNFCEPCALRRQSLPPDLSALF